LRILSDIFKAILTIFFVLTSIFFIIEAIPGDPAELLGGERASREEIEKIRKEFGLDKPLLERYKNTLLSAIKFDFGHSFYTKQKVRDIIIPRLKNTFLLAITTLVITFFLANLIFILYILFKKWEDAITILSTIVWSIPNFWLGVIFIILFSVKLRLLPVSGFENPKSLILPSLTLSISLSIVLGRFLKNLSEDFIKSDAFLFIRSKGVGFMRELLHITKAISAGIITVIGLQAGVLLSGTVITETVFSFPGIGSLTVQAVLSRDLPLLYGCVFSISSIWVLVNFVADKLAQIFDPRLMS
jgi:ABC-type dipeptide/oligopeptide/nickel transport systems, permease components